MNAITYNEPSIGSSLLRRRREIGANFAPALPIADLPVLLMTRADGSKGLDLTTSLIDGWLFDSYGQRAFVIQIGGSKGLIGRSHPSDCYERVDLFASDISTRLLNLIASNRNAQPILLMIDPNFLPKMLDLLDGFRTLELDLNMRALVLVAATGQFPNSINLLRNHFPTYRAMIDPPWTEKFPNDILRIPRLPEIFIERIFEEDLSIHDGEDQESIGSIISTAKLMVAFAKQLGIVYG